MVELTAIGNAQAPVSTLVVDDVFCKMSGGFAAAIGAKTAKPNAAPNPTTTEAVNFFISNPPPNVAGTTPQHLMQTLRGTTSNVAPTKTVPSSGHITPWHW